VEFAAAFLLKEGQNSRKGSYITNNNMDYKFLKKYSYILKKLGRSVRGGRNLSSEVNVLTIHLPSEN
jgi:hypothetical protein